VKKTVALTVAVVFLLSFAAPVFAQDMTHNAEYKMDGDINLEKQVGHLCNTGAEMKQVIDGEGEMTKVMDTHQVAGRLTVDDDQDWVTAEDAVRNLTVTSAIELCAPPKMEHSTTDYIWCDDLELWVRHDGVEDEVLTPYEYYALAMQEDGGNLPEDFFTGPNEVYSNEWPYEWGPISTETGVNFKEWYHGADLDELLDELLDDIPEDWISDDTNIPTDKDELVSLLEDRYGDEWWGVEDVWALRDGYYDGGIGSVVADGERHYGSVPSDFLSDVHYYGNVYIDWLEDQNLATAEDANDLRDALDEHPDQSFWSSQDSRYIGQWLDDSETGVPGEDYQTWEVDELTDQIWAVQVEADPGYSGGLSQDFEAAYGSYGGIIDDPEGDVPGAVDGFDGDDFWYFQPDEDGVLGVTKGDDYVGNYFEIDQMARTSQGTTQRYIDISSPWSGAYLHEDMTVTGMAEIEEDFEMGNLEPGEEAVPDWWDLF